MSKKNRKEERFSSIRISPPKKGRTSFEDLGKFEIKMRNLLMQQIFPIEQKMKMIQAELGELKDNIIVTNSLMINNKIFSEEDFFRQCDKHKILKAGVIDNEGNMRGGPAFSLYNFSE